MNSTSLLTKALAISVIVVGFLAMPGRTTAVHAQMRPGPPKDEVKLAPDSLQKQKEAEWDAIEAKLQKDAEAARQKAQAARREADEAKAAAAQAKSDLEESSTKLQAEVAAANAERDAAKAERDLAEAKIQRLETTPGGRSQITVTGRDWTTIEIVLSVAILIFALIVFFLQLRLMEALKLDWTPTAILRFNALTLIIAGGLLLVVSGYSDQQIAPVIGLLGTIAGYLLGATERPTKGRTADSSD